MADPPKNRVQIVVFVLGGLITFSQKISNILRRLASELTENFIFEHSKITF